jgi:hypothetical protein
MKRANDEDLAAAASELASSLKRIRESKEEDVISENAQIRQIFDTPKRKKALELVEAWGVAKTARETGIAKSNLKRWRKSEPHRKEVSGSKKIDRCQTINCAREEN